jgi:hypothetical protein
MKKNSWTAVVVGATAFVAVACRMCATTKALNDFLALCTKNQQFGVVQVGLNAFGNLQVIVDRERAKAELPGWFGTRRIIAQYRTGRA